jgi:hypothetical protein
MFLLLWISPNTKMRHWSGPYKTEGEAWNATAMRDNDVKYKWIIADTFGVADRDKVMEGLNS